MPGGGGGVSYFAFPVGLTADLSALLWELSLLQTVLDKLNYLQSHGPWIEWPRI